MVFSHWSMQWKVYWSVSSSWHVFKNPESANPDFFSRKFAVYFHFMDFHFRIKIDKKKPISKLILTTYILFITNSRAMRCLYIICIMGGYWMFQILPLPITSLIPIVAFPLGTIHILRQHIFRLFGPPSHPTEAYFIYWK